ncbi:MAG: hypothetical protein CVV27_07130 [Candidatus Melainabacteria bacterium HGW-Melainabacteria-1]|nr:MAG: hypothetical protein CVV27_07130 [Candidatus Melainabacteria bacterium HGW-Melainabacteria-1]
MKSTLLALLLGTSLFTGPGAALAKPGPMTPTLEPGLSYQSRVALAQDWQTAFGALGPITAPVTILRPAGPARGDQTPQPESIIQTIEHVFTIKAVGALVMIRYQPPGQAATTMIVRAEQVLGIYP